MPIRRCAKLLPFSKAQGASVCFRFGVYGGFGVFGVSLVRRPHHWTAWTGEGEKGHTVSLVGRFDPSSDVVQGHSFFVGGQSSRAALPRRPPRFPTILPPPRPHSFVLNLYCNASFHTCNSWNARPHGGAGPPHQDPLCVRFSGLDGGASGWSPCDAPSCSAARCRPPCGSPGPDAASTHQTTAHTPNPWTLPPRSRDFGRSRSIPSAGS